MKIASKRDYMLNLESVAMTDIVLNMFIFFFISFSLLYTFNPFRIQKLDVKLPQATNTSAIEGANEINITLTNEGIIYLDKEMVTTKELKAKVLERYRSNPKLSVMLSADKLSRFKEVVKILDMLSGIGVKQLNIAAVSE